jgi:hypothetical protein
MKPKSLSGISKGLIRVNLTHDEPNIQEWNKQREHLAPRVRASQLGLTQGFENKHHVLLTHRCPVPFLSQATR